MVEQTTLLKNNELTDSFKIKSNELDLLDATTPVLSKIYSQVPGVKIENAAISSLVETESKEKELDTPTKIKDVKINISMDDDSF